MLLEPGGDLPRRRFLTLGGRLAAGAAALRAPPPAGRRAEADARPRLARPWAARTSADMPAPEAAVHLLSRAAYGGTEAEIERLRALGTGAWVEEQLAFEDIDDSEVEGALAAGLPTLAMDLAALMAQKEHEVRVTDALNAATLYRQAFSPRRLFEVMVDFWSDHFSINQYLENAHWHKTVDDREVIRRHALGRFKELLTASARSPAMLHYLNNDENTRQQPNENYAREIMELHTLGVAVDGEPYSEVDVREVARCFTGWSWASRPDDPQFTRFRFFPERHDDGAKRVLGERIPAGGGSDDALRVIDLLCAHPSTPRFLATKLVRRFVTDDPLGQTPELVVRVAGAYTATDGDLRAMLRTLLTSPELAGAFGRYGGRLARPMDLAVRMTRALGVPRAALPPTLAERTGPFATWYYGLVGWDGHLNHMGQVPFGWLTPDGYPDVKERWTAAAVMLARWNMGLGFARGALTPGFLPGNLGPAEPPDPAALVDHWIQALLHRPMLAEDRDLVLAFFTEGGRLSPDQARLRHGPQTIALILDSPYFQWV